MSRSRSAAPVDRNRELGQTIGEVSRAWRELVNRRLKPFGLNQSMQQVLLQLHRHPDGLMQRDLAKRLSVEGPTVVKLLDFLEEKGWISRTPSDEDKRRKYCRLTAEATKQVVVIENVLSELRAIMLQDVSENELNAGLQLVRKLRDNLLKSIQPDE